MRKLRSILLTPSSSVGSMRDFTSCTEFHRLSLDSSSSIELAFSGLLCAGAFGSTETNYQSAAECKEVSGEVAERFHSIGSLDIAL